MSDRIKGVIGVGASLVICAKGFGIWDWRAWKTLLALAAVAAGLIWAIERYDGTHVRW